MLLRALVVVALFAPLAASVPADAATTALVASGPGRHVLIEDHLVYQTCEETAVVTVTYTTGFAGRTFIDVTGDGCPPTFSLLSGCQGVDADGWFRCHRIVSGGWVNATMSPDGVFVFSWDAADFTERIWANLTRVDV